MTSFRNKVIHKGMFPSRQEAVEYGQWAFQFVVAVGTSLREQHSEAANRIVAWIVGEASRKARAEPGIVGTQYAALFLSWIDSRWSQSSFELALEDLKERRYFTWAPPDEDPSQV
jgi:hypothetical protein